MTTRIRFLQLGLQLLVRMCVMLGLEKTLLFNIRGFVSFVAISTIAACIVAQSSLSVVGVV